MDINPENQTDHSNPDFIIDELIFAYNAGPKVCRQPNVTLSVLLLNFLFETSGINMLLEPSDQQI